MTGLAGGSVTGGDLRALLDEMHHEPWYGTERFEAGGHGVGLLHHGERDPEGYATWTGDGAAGVVDGALTNLDELGWTVAEFFERFGEDPAATARAVDGPFVVAYVDDDRVLVATDKVGCRPCYYTTDGRLLFGSELTALVPALDDPVVDVQGVSDMVLMGNMWSDDTLVEGVRSLHPSTVLEVADGERSTTRYWSPTVDPAEPGDAYLDGLTAEFKRAVDRVASTVSGDAGLWLSGGLDSRATLAELARSAREGSAEDVDSLTSFTYDANPGGGVNPRIARQVVDELDLPYEEVPLTADAFVPKFEECVALTDGMVRWSTFVNLSSVYNISEHDPDVVMEGMEGALVGHHLCRHHFTEPATAVESMYHSEAATSADHVRDVLDVDVDPMTPFRAEARRSEGDSMSEVVVDAHFRNYYHRLAHASNNLPRSQVGTRVPYADGQFLDYVASLPLAYRMGSLPFSDGELVYGVVKPKIRLIRDLDPALAAIPYERSRLKPTLPYPAHVAGFFGATALAQLRSQPTYGGRSMLDVWYDDHRPFRELMDGLLADAADRHLFDADTLRESQAAQQEGGGEMSTIAAVTTVEQWLQSTMD